MTPEEEARLEDEEQYAEGLQRLYDAFRHLMTDAEDRGIYAQVKHARERAENYRAILENRDRAEAEFERVVTDVANRADENGPAH